MYRFLLLISCFAGLAALATAQTGARPGQSPKSHPTSSAGEAFQPITFGDSPSHAYQRPFFPGQTFDPGVSSPETLLGHPVGSRLAAHSDIVAAFRVWARESARVDLASYGRTFEGRELVRVVISSAPNIQRLAQIRASIGALADPRGLDEDRAKAILGDTPAIAWMGYSIHGDETSGTDASLSVAYRLIAGTDAEVRELLNEVVVVIDPCMNPDGRMRTVTQVEQNAGYVTNLDVASRHRGHWPFGRGNHYLFDMNRDWMAGVCPETRGRWRVAEEFPAQLFVDAHEMDGLDTYLFYPQAEPLNPELPPKLVEWQAVFALDQARAFDEFGWGYYTREWADAWYPGYSDAWGALNGAIGLLYEQGGVSGQPLERASGEVVSYRESVHGHVVSSLANLFSLAHNRQAILADYLAFRRAAIDPGGTRGADAFVVVPGRCPDRETEFVDLLVAQGLEVRIAQAPFDASAVQSSLLEVSPQRTFPAGCFLITGAQPKSALVHSYLNFDPRMDTESLLAEREALERGEPSKVYDVTAWDLGRAFDLDAYWCRPSVDWDGGDFPLARTEIALSRPVAGVAAPGPDNPYAFVVDGRADASVRFAARAMDLGLVLHVSDKPFSAAGQPFVRGSLLVRRHENEAGFEQLVARAAAEAGVTAVGTASGRSEDDGPDLGGGHFDLLQRPRVAVVAGDPVSSAGYGHIWHLLDVQLGLPFSILEARALASYDLRPYNVLILPPGDMEGMLGGVSEDLARWIDSGGLLIACGSSAAALVGLEDDLSSVVLRRDALGQLDEYAFAVQAEVDARAVDIDLDELWDGAQSLPHPADEVSLEDPEKEAAELERIDTWARRFAPTGAILRGHVDVDHWVTVGAGLELPISAMGASVFLSKDPTETPVRFASAEQLRLGGLLWSEARERIASSAYLTCERLGHGGIILFATPPAFRGVMRATARLLSNAIVYGPGLGAEASRGR